MGVVCTGFAAHTASSVPHSFNQSDEKGATAESPQPLGFQSRPTRRSLLFPFPALKPTRKWLRSSRRRGSRCARNRKGSDRCHILNGQPGRPPSSALTALRGCRFGSRTAATVQLGAATRQHRQVPEAFLVFAVAGSTHGRLAGAAGGDQCLAPLDAADRHVCDESDLESRMLVRARSSETSTTR